MAVSRATQLLRLGVGSAALASIPAMTYNFTVHANSDEPREERMIRITDLSVYDNPEDGFQYRYVPEEISPLRQVISEARQAVWEYLETVQETTDKMKEKFEIGKAHTQGLIDYLQNDPGMLPRAAVITVAGLGGIVAGYRGGVMRKLFFSATAVAAATSLCYPNEAVALTTDAYNVAAESITSLFPGQDSDAEGPAVVQGSTPTTADNQTTTVKGRSANSGDPDQARPESTATTADNSQTSKMTGASTKGEPAQSKQESTPTSADTQTTKVKKQRLTIEGDPGQSREEDRDMYTTRGS